jgi:integrase
MALNTNGKLLTVAEVENAHEPKPLHDGGGLWLDVRSATSASWAYRFTWGGKSDEFGFGSRKKVTLAQAREWRTWAQAHEAANRNPKIEFRSLKLANVRAANAPKQASVYELARDKFDKIAPDVTTADGRKKWLRSLHRDLIGPIADMEPAAVTREAVLDLMRAKYAKSPVMAPYVRQRLCTVLSWAKSHDMIPDPLWRNPARWEDNLENREEVVTDHVAVNHPSLPFEEIGAFVNKLRGLNDRRVVALALEWLILSANRADEAASADWSELDLDNDCWTIPGERMKMGLRHRVPLTDRHFAILDQMMPPGATEYPLSGPIFGKSISALRSLMHTVKDATITLHGFRATFSTWAYQQKDTVTRSDGSKILIQLFEGEHIEECLAHVPKSRQGVAGDYNRQDFLDFRRPILEAWAAYCAVVQGEKVVPLRRRRAA